jgi:basic membrane protein A
VDIKGEKMKIKILWFLLAVMILMTSCKEEWKPGMPLAKENIMIGVVHITNPFTATSGYSFAHQTGIDDMKRSIGLLDSQVLSRTDVNAQDPMQVESAIRELIAQGVNIIIATSWGYMDACEKLAREYPSVIFAHATGNRFNDTNFTNYFGRAYQARYLSGIIAGLQTRTNKIGFVAAWGTENSEVSGGINAFARGVEKVNPDARIFVRVTNSWFDPMGEAAASIALIAAGCDVITQHCDTANPQIEAQRASVWGIGYNSDMSLDAPDAVLTSVIWRWGAFYTPFVQSVIDGTFTTEPYFGSIKDGIVDITPLSKNIVIDPRIHPILEEERKRIESGQLNVFTGIMETNDGRRIGREGESLSDAEIHSGIDWHYHTVSEL